jgi:hypothetical protein
MCSGSVCARNSDDDIDIGASDAKGCIVGPPLLLLLGMAPGAGLGTGLALAELMDDAGNAPAGADAEPCDPPLFLWWWSKAPRLTRRFRLAWFGSAGWFASDDAGFELELAARRGDGESTTTTGAADAETRLVSRSRLASDSFSGRRGRSVTKRSVGSATYENESALLASPAAAAVVVDPPPLLVRP